MVELVPKCELLTNAIGRFNSNDEFFNKSADAEAKLKKCDKQEQMPPGMSSRYGSRECNI